MVDEIKEIVYTKVVCKLQNAMQVKGQTMSSDTSSGGQRRNVHSSEQHSCYYSVTDSAQPEGANTGLSLLLPVSLTLEGYIQLRRTANWGHIALLSRCPAVHLAVMLLTIFVMHRQNRQPRLWSSHIPHFLECHSNFLSQVPGGL